MPNSLILKKPRVNVSTIIVALYILVLAFHMMTIAATGGTGIAHLISRGLQMPLLILWLFQVNIEPNNGLRSIVDYKIKSLMLSALLFAWVGDILVVCDAQADHLFLIGVSCFLLSHFLFAWAMYTMVPAQNRLSALRKNGAILIISAVLTFGLIFYLRVSMGEVFIPGVVYLFSIHCMLATALDLMGVAEQSVYRLAVAGSLLFILSDIILAINKFWFPVAFGEYLTSGTYVIGQLALVAAIRFYLLKKKRPAVNPLQ